MIKTSQESFAFPLTNMVLLLAVVDLVAVTISQNQIVPVWISGLLPPS